ncbi:MAG: hypothetical protein GY822_08550 [Deltaproteobacteria bacterium]|nr:hypothetical protein [Deltaproteobacteria bacterium]
MSEMSERDTSRLNQLSNFYRRGRRLSCQNVVQLTGASTKIGALTEVVYGAAQLVYGFSLMEEQKYLHDDVHD